MLALVTLVSASLAAASLQPPSEEGPAPAAATEPAAAPESPPAPSAPAIDDERPVANPHTAPSSRAFALEAWETEHRRLKLHTGLSGGFAGAMVLTGVLLFILPGLCSDPDPDFGCGEHIVPYIVGAAMFPLALIPTGTGIYWGVRLHRHRKTAPTAVLRPSVGGFALHF